jgi:transposase
MDASGVAVKNDSPNDTHQDNRNDNEGYRRIELITGTTRRRRWSDDERARILAESFEPGANVSAVARRHGVNGGLLHAWRKKAKTRVDEAAQANAPLFIPVAIAKAGGDAKGETPRLLSPLGRMIEIETRGALVRVPGGVDPETLAVVLAALRRAG